MARAKPWSCRTAIRTVSLSIASPMAERVIGFAMIARFLKRCCAQQIPNMSAISSLRRRLNLTSSPTMKPRLSIWFQGSAASGSARLRNG